MTTVSEAQARVALARAARDKKQADLLKEQEKGIAAQLIDSQTSLLISSGFTFNGVTLSSSIAAQLRWLGAYTARSTMVYPFDVSNVDNTAFLQVVDASMLEAIYAALHDHVQSAMLTGVALKRVAVEG